MSILSQISKKPWLATDDIAVNLQPHPAFSMPIEKVGLRVFLAAITVLFTLITISYVDHTTLLSWHPLPEPGLLWLNTLVLIFSSAALQWARVAAKRGQIDDVKRGFIAGGVFGFLFLLGQLWAWQQLIDLGYFAASNTANAFFYLITGLHAVHLAGGLVAWVRTSTKIWRGFSASKIALSVELCAVYWHFLLLVWLLLFTLMLFT